MKHTYWLSTLLLLTGFQTPVSARPLITEIAETAGPLNFEGGFSLARRIDEYGTPRIKYETVRIPFEVRLGVSKRWDVGFLLSHLSHRIESGQSSFTGSRPGLFSPFVKHMFNDRLGVLTTWHSAQNEKDEQQLPIGRGNDFEVLFLLRVPSKYVIDMNLGYLIKDSYKSNLGVPTATPITVKPSDIFEAKTSLQIPLPKFFSIITELAYYRTGSKFFGPVKVPNSSGEALDSLVGLSWDRWGCHIGAGASFGLLDESHTSFDLERGSGDVTYHLKAIYHLNPVKKPQ